MADTIARSELILGGQRSGKSRRAELLARSWLEQSPGHEAVLIATGQPWDDEMRARIARHQLDRAERVPGMRTVEEPLSLPEALASCSNPHTIVVVDCLTLWLTNQLMPAENNESNKPLRQPLRGLHAMLSGAIASVAGPVILVSNEIGLGVIPKTVWSSSWRPARPRTYCKNGVRNSRQVFPRPNCHRSPKSSIQSCKSIRTRFPK